MAEERLGFFSRVTSTAASSTGAQERRLFFAALPGDTMAPEGPEGDMDHTALGGDTGEVTLDFNDTHVTSAQALHDLRAIHSSRRSRRTRLHYDNTRRAAKAKAKAQATPHGHGRGSVAMRRQSADRLEKLICMPRCHCARRTCYKQFQSATAQLGTLLTAFSALPKLAQDTAIAMAISRHGDGSEIHLKILGKSMGALCLQKLLSLGKHRMGKLLAGPLLDGRQAGTHPARASPKARHCDRYFLSLYLRIAESLPHKFFFKKSHRQRKRYQRNEHAASTDTSGDTSGIAEGPEAAEQDMSLLAEVSTDRRAWGRYIDSGEGHRLNKFSLRHLPPGTVHDLYMDYASAPGTNNASYSAFLRRWQAHWSKVLRFRQPSDFADCQTCFEHKRAIANAQAHLLKTQIRPASIVPPFSSHRT